MKIDTQYCAVTIAKEKKKIKYQFWTLDYQMIQCCIVCSPQEHGAFLMHTQHLPMPLNPIDQKKNKEKGFILSYGRTNQISKGKLQQAQEPD